MNIKKRNLIKSNQRIAKKKNRVYYGPADYGINLGEAAFNLNQGINFGPIDIDVLNRVSGNIVIPSPESTKDALKLFLEQWDSFTGNNNGGDNEKTTKEE